MIKIIFNFKKNDYNQYVNASCFYTKLAYNVTTSALVNSPCSNGEIFEFNPNIDLKKLEKVIFKDDIY